MKIYEAIEALYDVLALDKNIAREILKELVEDEAVCFMLSISTHFSKPTPMHINRGGVNANIDYQLGQILHNISAPNRVFNSFFKTLDLKTQVVMKELLSASNKLDSTIFYGYAVRVYSKREILENLQLAKDTTDAILYLIVNSPKFYFKTLTTKYIYNTIQNKELHASPLPSSTSMYDSRGNTIAIGDVEFGHYLNGKTGATLTKIGGKFKKAENLVAIQYALNKAIGEKSAIVFHKDGIVILSKESLKLECDIIDFVLSEDFETVGVWVEYHGNVYDIRAKVPSTLVERGLDKYTATISANELVSGKLNNIEFIKFNLKGD